MSARAADHAAKPRNLRSKRLNGQLTARPDRRAFFFSGVTQRKLLAYMLFFRLCGQQEKGLK